MAHNVGLYGKLRSQDWVFEREILRRIYEPSRDPQMEEWRKIPNVLGIVNAIKRKMLKWVGHARRNPEALIKTVQQENPKEKRPLEDLGYDGKIASWDTKQTFTWMKTNISWRKIVMDENIYVRMYGQKGRKQINK